MKKSTNTVQMKPLSKPRPGLVPIQVSYRGAAGALLLLHALLSVLLQIGWVSMPDGTFGISKTGLGGYVTSAVLMQGICILLPVLFVMLWFKMPSGPALATASPAPGSLLLSLTVGVPAAVVFVGLNNGLVYVMSKAGIILPSASLPTRAAHSGGGTLIVVIMISVLLPGIIEELMFRGVIQGAMESEGGRFSAVFLQACAFAVFHADPLFILAPFLAGLLLGYVRRTTGSIYSCILTHITLNLTMLLMEPLLPRITSQYFTETSSLQLLYASLLAACVAAFALVPILVVFSSLPGKKMPVHEKLVFFPADWKFFLAMIFLFSTLLFVYFTNS